MFGLSIDQAKAGFFDRKPVIDATDKAARKVLSKFGAFVRQRARGSMRKRKKASKPDQPPSSHTGLIKKFLFFSYDPDKRSVIIGPARLNQKSGDALPALEFGGESRVFVGRRRSTRRLARTVTIKKRPFMGPASDKELPKVPEMWRDVIK